jgi:hypothetical protein
MGGGRRKPKGFAKVKLHAWGSAVAASGGHRDSRKGLEGCGAATPQAGPERESAEPRKARFSAQPKMRPDYAYSLFIGGGLDGAGS